MYWTWWMFQTSNRMQQNSHNILSPTWGFISQLLGSVGWWQKMAWSQLTVAQFFNLWPCSCHPIAIPNILPSGPSEWLVRHPRNALGPCVVARHFMFAHRPTGQDWDRWSVQTRDLRRFFPGMHNPKFWQQHGPWHRFGPIHGCCSSGPPWWSQRRPLPDLPSLCSALESSQSECIVADDKWQSTAPGLAWSAALAVEQCDDYLAVPPGSGESLSVHMGSHLCSRSTIPTAATGRIDPMTTGTSILIFQRTSKPKDLSTEETIVCTMLGKHKPLEHAAKRCVEKNTCIHNYRHIYLHIYMDIYIYTHKHIYIYTYIYRYIYTYMHKYIYIYIRV